MNVFLPYTDNIKKSVQLLDDRRLIKQILECKTILDADVYGHSGYANHCVTKHYKDQTLFLRAYATECCYEYSYRFKKIHAYASYFISIPNELLTGNLEKYKPLYAQGSVNSPVYYRLTDKTIVGNMFKEKLFNKWNKDIEKGHPPKWTNRNSGYYVLYNEFKESEVNYD